MSEFTDEQIAELKGVFCQAGLFVYDFTDIQEEFNSSIRAVAEHVATAKDARIAELASEITNAYDAIFLAVPQADDENGKRLTVAAKIELLAAENLRQQERIASLIAACETAERARRSLYVNGCDDAIEKCIAEYLEYDEIGRQLRKALEDSK